MIYDISLMELFLARKMIYGKWDESQCVTMNVMNAKMYLLKNDIMNGMMEWMWSTLTWQSSYIFYKASILHSRKSMLGPRITSPSADIFIRSWIFFPNLWFPHISILFVKKNVLNVISLQMLGKLSNKTEIHWFSLSEGNRP